MLKDSDAHCPDIFHNLYIEPINKDSINVAACCQARAHTAPLESFSFASDTVLVRLRENTSKSIKSPECDKCWNIEALGGRSRRHSVIDEYGNTQTIASLISLDINVTWACNLACVMCGPQWSSTWAKEIGTRKDDLEKLGRQDQKNNSWIDRINFSQVRRIHFNGGEPLLNNMHKVVMRRMLDEGNLAGAAISYNTNGTQFPDSETLDLWSRARLVKIYFSLDAVEDAFEYVRYPAAWNDVQENILQVKNTAPSNVMLGINATIGCYNVLEIQSLWEWFCENIATNREGDVSDFCWQPSNGFEVDKLRLDAKQAAITQLKTITVLHDLRTQLSQHSTVDDGWIEHFEILDQRRGTNWRQALNIDTYYRG